MASLWLSLKWDATLLSAYRKASRAEMASFLSVSAAASANAFAQNSPKTVAVLSRPLLVAVMTTRRGDLSVSSAPPLELVVLTMSCRAAGTASSQTFS